jgi:CPA2 family monovalent cation:H+ antiporter-2
LSLAQIGEFSFIIAALGSSLKVTGDQLPAVAVAVSAVTTFTTPLLIKKSSDWADLFESRLPAGFLKRIESYRASLQTKSTGSMFSTLISVYGPKILIYATLIIGIALAGKRWVLPFMFEILEPSIASVACLAVVLLAAAPFFWGLIFSHPRDFQMPRLRGLEVGIGLTRALIGATLFAFCVAQYLSAVAATGLVVVAVSAVALLFTRFAEPLYRIFESSLRLSFEEQRNQSPTERPKLAPWDATLTQFQVSADSKLAGLTLIASAIKERFGVSVALIERGSKRILAPGREMLLLPGDRVFLIGTETQIANAGSVIEARDVKHEMEVDQGPLSNFGLSSLVLEDTSPFLGRTIRASGLREKISGLIVGIERDGDRILNPDSGLILQSSDLLWIVGDVDRIHKLRHPDKPASAT